MFDMSELSIRIQWLAAPYDPELAAEAALSLGDVSAHAERILQRQSAFDPNLHLIVDDVFPTVHEDGKLGDINTRWSVFCTQGHRFEGRTPLEAAQAAEGHVK